jgi:quercetin dioxygenase-like cupin family protein
MTPLPQNTLPGFKRFVTTHNDKGAAIFATGISDVVPQSAVPGAYFSLAFATSTVPTSLQNDEDLPIYGNYLNDNPGLVISKGSVCRVVDIGPGVTSAMHRTVSLDYGVVLEGEVELILDSGETRRMQKGDIAVQRGTCHAWKNITTVVGADGREEPGWARMLYVLLPIVPVVVDGNRELGESVPGMGVQPSS